MFRRRVVSLRAAVTFILACAGAGAPAHGVWAADPAAHPLADYHEGAVYLPLSSGAAGGAAGAFYNPASWATNDRVETAFWWNDRSARSGRLDNWGLSIGRRLGLAMQHLTVPSPGGWRRVSDYQIGLAGGDRRAHYGLAWRFPGANDGPTRREQALVAGTIVRPAPWMSCGLSGAFSARSRARLGIADLAVRPFGAPWLTLGADYSWRDGQRLSGGRWGAGAELRPLPGLHLGVKFHEAAAPDDYRFTLHAGVTLGGTGWHVLPSYDRAGRRDATAFLLRLDPPHRPLPLPPGLGLDRRPRYVPVDLENRRLTYQSYRWFDDRNVGWLGLARHLQSVRDDRGVDGVAINLAGLRSRPSLAWELRRELDALRAAGKEVVVHADRLDLLGLYIASAADRVTLDPQGDVTLPGVALSRTYMKGLLDKLGLGFQELRYFPYKSAAEVLAREQMSPGEREQRQRLVDVIYETARDAICAGTGLTAADFDSLVDDAALLRPEQAAAAGLVDGVARWHDLPDWLRTERSGARLGAAPGAAAAARRYHDERWGRPPAVAIVYAVGECALDEGIKGRETSAHLRRLAEDPGVAAVVLRADSPGGDPLPSDLVAEGIAHLVAAGKPVVVSQGDVAASGGYWISMNGSRVLTTPLTITGSIGVIAGWLYDDGLGDRLGLRADGVQRGAHADLFAPLRLPLLGAPLPVRPLDDGELALVKRLILDMYDAFVAGVAAGRGLSADRVRELGGGRVWMGADAVARGLCDDLGTLPDAIALARELAGIAPDAEVILREHPPRPLFAWPKLPLPLPGLGAVGRAAAAGFAATRAAAAGAAAADTPPLTHPQLPIAGLDPLAEPDQDAALMFLRRVAGSPARPLLWLPPDLLPPGWGAAP